MGKRGAPIGNRNASGRRGGSGKPKYTFKAVNTKSGAAYQVFKNGKKTNRFVREG